MNKLPSKESLVSQTATIIVEEIQAGRWTHWLPGEFSLSADLHVSRRTVRKALELLEEQGVVKCEQGKRRRIAEVKSTTVKRASRRVVLLMPVPLLSLNPFAVFLIDHLREHLGEAGYTLDIHASRVPYRARMPQELQNLEASLRPAGWVLLQSTEEMQKWFAASHRPCVVVGSLYANVHLPSVDTDYDAVCHHAVGRFLARGRRFLALLNPDPGAAGDAKTLAGFMAAIERARLPDLRAEVLHHDGTPGNICLRLDALMRRAQRPTGLLISRPKHVLTVLGHLQQQGIRIPHDMAIISRDDDSFMEDVVPTVARYSRNPRLFASKVSGVVLEMVQGAKAFKAANIMPRFIDGQTLG